MPSFHHTSKIFKQVLIRYNFQNVTKNIKKKRVSRQISLSIPHPFIFGKTPLLKIKEEVRLYYL